ncbi:flagellar filament capping protein FliD [Sphingomonas sp.]|uniref:flagellar filament capping protein FliD n=1 Tax=Sphingomonas sp. TaxID=28214 RepID=UPI003AFF9B06
MTTTSTTSSTTSATTTTSSKSNSSLGASIVSSLNAGSGVDTDTLVTNLVAAQKASLEDAITTKQTANTAQLSAAATLSADITAFSGSLDTLISGGTLMTQPTSSNTAVATASAVAGSRIGSLSATLNVTQLAKAQTVESQPVSTSASYASGGMTIATTGGASVTLAAGTDFTSLPTLVAAINAKTAATGVAASIVKDGNGSHLVMKGTTGASQGFSVTANGDVAGFAYAPVDGDTAAPDVVTGAGMQRLQAAQDAAFTVDGVSYTRSSNTVGDAIPGVKLTLAATGTTGLTATRPTDAIAQAVTDFVSAYNTLKTEIDSATAASTSSSDAGALRGNATIRDMQQRLAKLTTTPLIASGSITTLAQLGVQTGRDGTLSVSASTLNSVIVQYPDDVEAMFNPTQSASSGAVTIRSKVGVVAAGTYRLTDLVASSGATAASGKVNGVAASGSGSLLTAATGNGVDGLMFSVGAGAPSSATLSIDLGLGGALSLIKTALAGTGGTLTALTSTLKTQASTFADQITAAEAKLTVYHDRLVSQFSTMNTRVSGYKATQSYLTQQIDLWTKSDN